MTIATIQILPFEALFISLQHVIDELDKVELPLSDHKNQLIRIILQKYFKIRLCHEAATKQDSIHRIKSRNTKVILFKNQ